MKKILCLLGFHKWYYSEKRSYVRDMVVKRAKRNCERCGKDQEFKASPPCYSLIDANFKWTSINSKSI